MSETFNTKLAIEAQRLFVASHEYPHFAPPDGHCYNCEQDIYSPVDHGDHITGITVDCASGGLVTGCPHCHHSYCE